jgi:hypothetical protein
MDPQNPPRFAAPLVEYELDEAATDVVLRHLAVAIEAGHGVAGRLAATVNDVPGRVLTLAPQGTPVAELNEFEGLRAVHQEHFAPWGLSPQWDEWITQRLEGISNPFVLGLDLVFRPSHPHWTTDFTQNLRKLVQPTHQTLFVDGETVVDVVQGPDATVPSVVGGVIGSTRAEWAAVAVAGESGRSLPEGQLVEVEEAAISALVAGTPRVIVVNPYTCMDGHLFWVPSDS